MPADDKTIPRQEVTAESQDLEGLLGEIQNERIPARLLTLAHELQRVLNLRKAPRNQN
jgi:hypothetical protein